MSTATMVLGAVTAAWVSAAGGAHAAEPDTVLVAPFLSQDGAPDSLSEAIAEVLSDDFHTVLVDQAPALEDYSARVYLQACPSGQYLGCVFVIAERSQATWAIAGSVAPAEHGVDATVQFIDVLESSVLFALTVPVPDDESRDAVLEVLASTLQWVAGGGATGDDLRGSILDARAGWEEGRQGAAAAALDLVEIEKELGGQLEVGGRVKLDRPQLTASDLADIAGDAAVTPWDRLAMSEAEFLRFQNSGLDEAQWRARGLGRALTVRFRVGGGAGYGPFGAAFDGRYARDGTTAEVIERASMQDLVPAIGGMGRIELGFGFHKLLELAVSAELRPSFVRHAFQQEYVGDAYPLGLGQDQLGTLSAAFGGHLALVSRPSYAFRPLFAVGIARWAGPPVESTVDVPEEILTLAGPSALLIELSPGFEADVAPAVAIFLRGIFAVSPGAGEWLAQEGGGGLSELPTAHPGPSVGATAYVGVQLRGGPLGGVDLERGSFDDDFGEP